MQRTQRVHCIAFPLAVDFHAGNLRVDPGVQRDLLGHRTHHGQPVL